MKNEHGRKMTDADIKEQMVKSFNEWGGADAILKLATRVVPDRKVKSKVDYHIISMILEQQKIGETHPVYLQMIDDAIVKLNDRYGE